MPNPLVALVNAFRSRLYEAVYFLTEVERVRGVSPAVSFKTMTSVYLGDLATRDQTKSLSLLQEHQECCEGKKPKMKLMARKEDLEHAVKDALYTQRLVEYGHSPFKLFMELNTIVRNIKKSSETANWQDLREAQLTSKT